MNYFEAFPTIEIYGHLIRDISRRSYIPNRYKDRIDLFYLYDVKDGDTPESVSFQAYGTTDYHWVIMFMNDIIDPFHDWPMTDSELEQYVTNTYGDPNAIHHYELNGVVVESTTPGAAPISNLDYERRLNDAKRRIKILKPQYLDGLEEELRQTLIS